MLPNIYKISLRDTLTDHRPYTPMLRGMVMYGWTERRKDGRQRKNIRVYKRRVGIQTRTSSSLFLSFTVFLMPCILEKWKYWPYTTRKHFCEISLFENKSGWLFLFQISIGMISIASFLSAVSGKNCVEPELKKQELFKSDVSEQSEQL